MYCLRSPLLKAFRHKSIFIERFIFILAGKRLLELTHVIRSMKREGKHGGLMRRRLHIKTTPFRLSSAVFQYSSLSFPYLTCPTIVCKFFILAKKISRSADRRCIFFFRIFVCIKGYSSSDSGPLKENFRFSSWIFQI